MQEWANYFHLKELGGLELLKAQYHHKQFSKHVHEGYCIGVIEDGAQSFYRTGQLHTAPKGDIILVNADEIHTGSSAVESGWKYRAIYPTPEMLLDAGQDFLVSKIVCLGFLMLLFTMLAWHSSLAYCLICWSKKKIRYSRKACIYRLWLV